MSSRITDFEIKLLNIDNLPTEFYDFCSTCESEGLVNNVSADAMKIGKWGKDAWWCTWYKDAIISISGCHAWPEYEKDAWRLMVRTATLKEFRGRAPGSLRYMHNDFNWGHILSHQVDYAARNGAKKMYFTTNSDSSGDSNSLRTNKAIAKTFEPNGLAKLVEKDATVFYTKQNVWRIMNSGWDQ